MVLVVRDFFAKRQGDAGAIMCYAQDPIFTDTDKQVLQEQGITVLDNPHGFLEMDQEAVVISHSADVPVRSITAELAQPAMMIWDKVMDDELLVQLGLTLGEEEEDDESGDEDGPQHSLW